MGFRIGSPFSPIVTAALLRRGETGPGPRISRRDPIKRTVHQTDVGEDQASDLELLREQRLARALDLDEERRQREEEREGEAFDFSKEVAIEGIQRQRALDEERRAGAGKPDPKQARQVRVDGRKIILDIHKILKESSKPDPNTGKVDAQAFQQAQQVAAVLWQDYLALGLPEDEIRKAAQLLGLEQTTPPSRAPGNAAPNQPTPAAPAGAGISRDGPRSALQQYADDKFGIQPQGGVPSGSTLGGEGFIDPRLASAFGL